MQPSPNPAAKPQPVLEVLDALVPADSRAAAWDACSGSRWQFGHGSLDLGAAPFWKLDLDGDAAAAAIWEQARRRCEELAGAPLRVLRVYANGHTRGLGGRAQAGDPRPGAFTLLYYPMPEWQDGWDGEMMFSDASGEIALVVRPRPNRAVFFDSRILREGQPPSRSCPALRVTIAYELETCASSVAVEVKELRREGPQRSYSVRIPRDAADAAALEHLRRMGRSVRLPGYRQGEVPDTVLNARYGAQARLAALDSLVAKALERELPKGSVPAAVELTSGATGGDAEAHAMVTVLGDLPAPDLSGLRVVRLTAEGAAADAQAALRAHLTTQLLDFLDAVYRFPLRPSLVDRELDAIFERMGLAGGEAREAAAAELRPIAERRVRLAFVIDELARRLGIRSRDGAGREEAVLDALLAQAAVEERPATADELRDVTGE